MISSRDIRTKFLTFFAEKKHARIESSSLLPQDDNTVLFTTAGMQQFVPYLMGKKHPQGTRLCSVQKCVRTVDIEEVGDNRHLTFFEMLGNWSLGDYFKKEAIAWSYEFLTEVLSIRVENIWVTVFGGDDDVPLDTESMDIWQEIGIPKERIIPIGPKKGAKKNRGDNFWGPAGKTGPCGPSTEMYVYIGKTAPQKDQTPATDEENFIEVWNDVFMEYNQDENGNLTKLSQKNVDTGMGLERMTMVLNNLPTVFETDSFSHIFKALETVSGKKYPPYQGENDEKNPTTRAMRIIADHVRAITHIIADGAVPSNEGQGYVLRRLIRRAVRAGRKLGLDYSFLKDLAAVHISTFQEWYPEIAERESVILSTTQIEAEKFNQTLERGERMLEEMLAQKPKQLSGADAFKLFDTYGFPLDLTKEIAREQNISVDEEGFEKEMEEQRKRARKNTGDFFDRDQRSHAAFEKLEKTKFVGYEQNESSAKILLLQPAVNAAEEERLMVKFALDTTPFYAESGGQVSDIGVVVSNGNAIEVLNVEKLSNGVFLHTGKVIQGNPKVGEIVEATIDIPRRKQICRHHSVTHLLHAALRSVLGDHVQQQGSLVTPEQARFDFSHPKAMSIEEIRRVEWVIMQCIIEAHDVKVKEMHLEEAKKAGAIALFSEKYDKSVRTIRIEDKDTKNQISFELCGGTHVKNTAEIGAIKIISESSVASGIRRIEIVCGMAAQELLWEQSTLLDLIATKLKVPSGDIENRITSIFKEKKDLQNELQKTQDQLIRYEAQELLDLQTEINGFTIICEPIPTGDNKKIGALARELVKHGNDLVALFTRDGGVAVASQDSISAKEILEKITGFAGGNGGGGKQFAQGANVNLEEFRGIRTTVQDALSAQK